MAQTIQFEITREDVEQALEKTKGLSLTSTEYWCNCPVATALRRVTGKEWVVKQASRIRLVEGSDFCTGNLNVQHVMEDFDYIHSNRIADGDMLVGTRCTVYCPNDNNVVMAGE